MLSRHEDKGTVPVWQGFEHHFLNYVQKQAPSAPSAPSAGVHGWKVMLITTGTNLAL